MICLWKLLKNGEILSGMSGSRKFYINYINVLYHYR